MAAATGTPRAAQAPNVLADVLVGRRADDAAVDHQVLEVAARVLTAQDRIEPAVYTGPREVRQRVEGIRVDQGAERVLEQPILEVELAQ